MLRCSFLCVVVAGKKWETGKRSLFNVALIRTLFLLCFFFVSTLFLLFFCLLSDVSLVLCLPRLIGDLWLRFLATQTANFEELPCGAAVCMASAKVKQLARVC